MWLSLVLPMPVANPTSAVAVTAQVASLLLLAVTFAYLARLMARPYLRRWAVAWACLLTGILAVRAAIEVPNRGLWVLYLVAGWYYLAALLIGCREMARGEEVRRTARFLLPGLPAAAILAGMVVPFFANFDLLFSAQAGALAAGYGAAFVILSQVPAARRTVGFHLLRAALGWLAVQFLLYVPLYLMAELMAGFRQGRLYGLLGYTSLADLCAQLLLGFGMVLVTADESQRELAAAVAELRAARDQLAAQAHRDPLTGALNRHAFQDLLASADGLPAGGRGALAMIDLDHLKEINDSAGHSAGDAAIRAAADAIRRLLRGTDLLYRWGGDEFLVLLPDCGRAAAAALLAPLADGARFTAAPHTHERQLHLTWGVTELAGACGQAAIDDAIARADRAMYGVRTAVRAPPVRSR
jgi:diguanylate cyclase (GGDEF)-like protein